ncbi:MAG TPA: putative 2OG-Fe(II) oxygenase [Dokdonella sp.]|uniref:putative 2OG-Fe(II) oxygenase n=1 Tax=Dokdonella sp. TaxID=2291710 RepID=UPI002D7E3C0B|nr:putative 2OG-Fe(II) oxygenase [Dokdonella sp.]HET9033735.1 putative 2OG-Fe(II) oxygenase [Dokdonella sp.]
MQINGLFPVPFGHDHHPDAARLNAALRTLFLARESEGRRHANPGPITLRNEQVFESHFQLFSWPEREIVELREFCLSRVARIAGELNGYDVNQLARLDIKTDAWFHVTRRGGFFGVHNHPLASWSGVYCVSAGQNDANQPDSGLLNFIHPHIGQSMYLDAGNERFKEPFGIQNFGLSLQPGQLVLFPSWLLHQVLPFYGEGERISVAFNCSMSLG